MFHTILTLSYIIPGVYLFVRIWQLFIPREYRYIFLTVFFLLFSVYPVSNLLGERNTGLSGQIISAAGNYLLPFFLYLFLLVLLTDLLLLVNLIFKIVPGEKIRKRSFRGAVFVLIISLPVIIVIAGIINFNTIRISEYKITTDGKSSRISRLRIAFVSDFHLQEGTPAWFVEKFTDKISTINPDLILFGGDIVEGDREGEKLKEYEKLLSGITTKYGVFGVLGNHEHYARQDKGSFFRLAGIEILSDSAVVIDHSFILAGRNDSHFRARKSAEELLKTVPDTLPLIVADHRPTEIDQISKTSADIVLSGHTHDGQLFPINLITRRVYELSYGHMKKGKTDFFVSSGIRLWGPPVRTAGKSEIMVIDVTFH